MRSLITIFFKANLFPRVFFVGFLSLSLISNPISYAQEGDAKQGAEEFDAEEELARFRESLRKSEQLTDDEGKASAPFPDKPERREAREITNEEEISQFLAELDEIQGWSSRDLKKKRKTSVERRREDIRLQLDELDAEEAEEEEEFSLLDDEPATETTDLKTVGEDEISALRRGLESLKKEREVSVQREAVLVERNREQREEENEIARMRERFDAILKEEEAKQKTSGPKKQRYNEVPVLDRSKLEKSKTEVPATLKRTGKTEKFITTMGEDKLDGKALVEEEDFYRDEDGIMPIVLDTAPSKRAQKTLQRIEEEERAYDAATRDYVVPNLGMDADDDEEPEKKKVPRWFSGVNYDGERQPEAEMKEKEEAPRWFSGMEKKYEKEVKEVEAPLPQIEEKPKKVPSWFSGVDYDGERQPDAEMKKKDEAPRWFSGMEKKYEKEIVEESESVVVPKKEIQKPTPVLEPKPVVMPKVEETVKEPVVSPWFSEPVKKEVTPEPAKPSVVEELPEIEFKSEKKVMKQTVADSPLLQDERLKPAERKAVPEKVLRAPSVVQRKPSIDSQSSSKPIVSSAKTTTRKKVVSEAKPTTPKVPALSFPAKRLEPKAVIPATKPAKVEVKETPKEKTGEAARLAAPAAKKSEDAIVVFEDETTQFRKRRQKEILARRNTQKSAQASKPTRTPLRPTRVAQQPKSSVAPAAAAKPAPPAVSVEPKDKDAVVVVQDEAAKSREVAGRSTKPVAVSQVTGKPSEDAVLVVKDDAAKDRAEIKKAKRKRKRIIPSWAKKKKKKKVPLEKNLFAETFYLMPEQRLAYDTFDINGLVFIKQANPGMDSQYAVVTNFAGEVIKSRSLPEVQTLDDVKKWLKNNLETKEFEGVEIKRLPFASQGDKPKHVYWVGHKSYASSEQARNEIAMVQSVVLAQGKDFKKFVDEAQKYLPPPEQTPPVEIKGPAQFQREETLMLKYLDQLDIGEKMWGPLHGEPGGEPIVWQSFGETTWRMTNLDVKNFSASVGFWTNRLVFKGIRFPWSTIDPFIESTVSMEAQGKDFATNMKLFAGVEWRPFARNPWLFNYRPWGGISILEWIKNYRFYVMYGDRKNIKDPIEGSDSHDLIAGVQIFYEWGVELPPLAQPPPQKFSEYVEDLVWGEYFGNYRWEMTNFGSEDDYDGWILNSSVLLGVKLPPIPLPENPINNELVLMPYVKLEHVNATSVSFPFQNSVFAAAGVRWMPFRTYRFKENEWLSKTKVFVEYVGIGKVQHFKQDGESPDAVRYDFRVGVSMSSRRF